MSLTTITVTGSYPAGAGSGVAEGYVTFVPTARVVNASGHTIIPQLPVQVPLQLGAFSLPVVVCTDNAGLTPTGWAWQVTENINGVQADPYYVFIPSSYGASVDLSELAEAQAGPVITTYAQVGAANTFTETNVFSDGLTVEGGLDLDGTTIATPPGGTTDFLRADGTWAAPPGGASTAYSRQLLIAADGPGSTITPPVGTWTPTYLMTSDTDGVWSGWVDVSDGAQNDSVSFDLAAGAGTYELELRHLAYNNRGIYTIQIDGVNVGTIDGYAASLTAARSILTGITISSGAHVITLLMATQNASASGFFGLIERILLTRTA